MKSYSKTKKIIPIFFACDDNYAKYLGVTIKSLMINANKKDYSYRFYILETDLNPLYLDKFKEMMEGDSTIEYVDVRKEIKAFRSKLSLRDYYTSATYYRLFIMELFPQYDKVVYLDSDLLIKGDISRFYNYNISNHLLGAVQDEVLYLNKPFALYSILNVGVPTNKYFNAGVLLMNLQQMRKQDIYNKFINLLTVKSFPVAQDQDYLNYLCKNQVRYLPLSWNKNPIKNSLFNDKNVKIVHFKMAWKPWKYDGILYEKLFWEYAKQTCFYKEILDAKNNYSELDKARDEEHSRHLLNMVIELNNEALAKLDKGVDFDVDLAIDARYC